MTLISSRRLLSSCVWSLISWRVLSLNGCAVSCWCSQSLKGLPGFHRRVNKLDLGCRPGTWSIPSYSQGLRLKGALTTELNHSIDGHNILVLHPDKSHLLHRWISSNRRRLVIVHNNKFDLIPFGILGVRYYYSTRSKRSRDYVVVHCELFAWEIKQFDCRSKKLCGNQNACHATIQFKLDWFISDVNCSRYMNPSYFTLIHRTEREAVFIKLASTIWFDIYSRFSKALRSEMIHSSAKRVSFPKRWATFLGSPMFSATEFASRYFFMYRIFCVPIIIFAPFVSRIVMPFVNWHVTALRLLLQWVYRLMLFYSFSPCLR